MSKKSVLKVHSDVHFQKKKKGEISLHSLMNTIFVFPNEESS